MIPYFTIPSIHLFGSVYLHPFGVLLVLGIIIAYRVMMSRADDLQIPGEEMKGALIAHLRWDSLAPMWSRFFFINPKY